jgi:NTE family protein
MENFGRRDTAGMLDIRLASGGLIEGRRVESFLNEFGIAGDIETLPMRFGAVATELASGREVWLQTGSIVRAVRASIGMPGIFSPAKFEEGNGWLIDGGLVDPVPVPLARALGADIVIAVDLNAELVGRRLTDGGGGAVSAVPAPAVPA